MKFTLNFVTALVFSGALFGATAHADNLPSTADVGVLKQKVAPFRNSIDAGTAMARGLKFQMKEVTNEITYDQCMDLQRKIEAQYPLSPFHAIYKDGAAFSQFCEWDAEYPLRDETLRSGMRYFLDKVKTVNQMGVSGEYVMKIIKPMPTRPAFGNTPTELEFVLDGQLKIMERTTRTYDKDGMTIDWDVSSINSLGDNYYLIGTGNSPLAGTVQRAFYASGDGTLFGGWIKKPRRADQGNEIIINHIFEVHQKDWSNFSLILTFWMGRFYQYSSDEWTSRTNTSDYLYEVTLADSGTEVCADGRSNVGANWTVYKPSDNKEPWSCANSW